MPLVLPSTIHNPTSGQVAPATWGDAVNDVPAYLGRDKPHCRAYNSANISVANTTEVALTLNSERYDVGGCHSTSSNTSRLTVPAGEGGLYTIKGNAAFAADNTGSRILLIRLNGTVHIAQDRRLNCGGTDPVEMSVACDYQLAATDYVELVAYQNSGGALNILTAANYSPEFMFRWVCL